MSLFILQIVQKFEEAAGDALNGPLKTQRESKTKYQPIIGYRGDGRKEKKSWEEKEKFLIWLEIN